MDKQGETDCETMAAECSNLATLERVFDLYLNLKRDGKISGDADKVVGWALAALNVAVAGAPVSKMPFQVTEARGLPSVDEAL